MEGCGWMEERTYCRPKETKRKVRKSNMKANKKAQYIILNVVDMLSTFCLH